MPTFHLVPLLSIGHLVLLMQPLSAGNLGSFLWLSVFHVQWVGTVTLDHGRPGNGAQSSPLYLSLPYIRAEALSRFGSFI